MNDQNQVLINIDQLTKKLPYYAKVASNMQEPGIVDMEVGLFTYPYPKEEKKQGIVQRKCRIVTLKIVKAFKKIHKHKIL